MFQAEQLILFVMFGAVGETLATCKKFDFSVRF